MKSRCMQCNAHHTHYKESSATSLLSNALKYIFLRKLRNAHLPSSIQTTFYREKAIESILVQSYRSMVTALLQKERRYIGL